MRLKFKNKTEQGQQIMYADGSCITVIPGAETEIETSSLFSDEITRAKMFFDISPVKGLPPVKTDIERSEKPVDSLRKRSEKAAEAVEDKGGVE